MNHKTTRHPNRTHSLRWRLLNMIGVIFLLTLVLIGTSVYYFIYQNEQQMWQTRQREAAHFAGDAVSSFMRQAGDTLRLLSSLSTTDLAGDPQISAALLEQNPGLLELVRLTSAGEPVAHSARDAPVLANLFTIPQSNWFVQAKAGQTYLGSVQISPASEPYLIMALPTTNGGVVAARLRMVRLWEVMGDLHFGDTGQSYVANAEGRIVAHTNPEIALANTNLAGRPELAAVRQAGNGSWNGAYTNFQGTNVLGVIAPLSETGWVIFTEVAEAEAFASSRTALLLLALGLTTLGLVIIGITGRFLGTTVLQPIEHLQTGAVRLGQGDLDHRIPLTSNLQGEMRQVAVAFNEMANRLQERDEIIASHTQALRESEARFRQVASSISDHIYMLEITPEGEYINRYASPNITELTGYPPEKFTNDWSFWPRQVIHPADRAAATAQAERLARAQDSELEYRLVRADGTIVWVRDSGRVEHDLESGSLLIFGVVSDITARKEAEEALHRQRAFLQRIIDVNPHYIFAKDRHGRYTLANRAFAEAYATNVQEIIGKTDADFNPIEEMVERYERDDLSVIETGEELIIPEDEITNIYGEKHWRYTIKRPLKDEAGNVYQVLGVATDITYLKQAEETIRLAHDQAVKANELKTRLLANVSHDLRTPLGAILGYIEMLEFGTYGPLTSEQRRVTTRVIESIENLTRMVNNLLDQARLEAQSFTLHENPIEPRALTGYVLNTMQSLAIQKGLALQTNVVANVPPLVRGDLDRLQQIVNNLVGNALKFTETGSVTLQIYCPDESHWAIEVADTGPGIASELHALIFEPFQQVDGSVTRQYSGSGLGLSIVKHLVALMNGDIHLESDVGKGSTFTVTLPLSPVPEIAS